MEATAVMLDFEGEGMLFERVKVVGGEGGNRGERREEEAEEVEAGGSRASISLRAATSILYMDGESEAAASDVSGVKSKFRSEVSLTRLQRSLFGCQSADG